MCREGRVASLLAGAVIVLLGCSSPNTVKQLAGTPDNAAELPRHTQLK